jgi:hypothetical protein
LQNPFLCDCEALVSRDSQGDEKQEPRGDWPAIAFAMRPSWIIEQLTAQVRAPREDYVRVMGRVSRTHS